MTQENLKVPRLSGTMTFNNNDTQQLDMTELGSHLADDGETMRSFYLNDHARNTAKRFKSNYIRTTKYTAVTFLPLCLFVQFKRLANIYFLLMAILQSIKIISPLNPTTAILPLVFVITVSMIREGIEDYMRYTADKGKFTLPHNFNIFIGFIHVIICHSVL